MSRVHSELLIYSLQSACNSIHKPLYFCNVMYSECNRIFNINHKRRKRTRNIYFSIIETLIWFVLKLELVFILVILCNVFLSFFLFFLLIIVYIVFINYCFRFSSFSISGKVYSFITKNCFMVLYLVN